MGIKEQLREVTGEDIGVELNSYGSDVVGYAPPQMAEVSQEAQQAFIDAFAVKRSTPILVMSNRTVHYLGLPQGQYCVSSPYTLESCWRYMPGAPVDPSTIHELMVGRFKAGLPVTLIPQTANALRLNAKDLRAIKLSGLERAQLIWSVWRQRLPGAEPVLVMADFADGQRRKPIWWPSLARYRAKHRFAPVKGCGLRWTEEG